MRAERFQIAHLDLFANYGGQEPLVADLSRDELAFLTEQRPGNHYSLWSGTRLMACMGVVGLNRFRGAAWALLQRGSPSSFVGVHRLAYRLLRAQPYKRIEATIDPTSWTATRWIAMLGFRLEIAYRPYFFPDGRPAAEWALYLEGEDNGSGLPVTGTE